MKKLLIGIILIILFFVPIPTVFRLECKAGLIGGVFYECPRLPERTQNIWDGYFLTWHNSLAQSLFIRLFP